MVRRNAIATCATTSILRLEAAMDMELANDMSTVKRSDIVRLLFLLEVGAKRVF